MKNRNNRRSCLSFRVPCWGVLLLLALAAPTATAGEPMLNAQVKLFAQRHLGQRVGNGQCAALADEALKAAGAMAFLDFGVFGADADYVWGARVLRVADLQPGDVLQLRNVKVVDTTAQWTPQGIYTLTSVQTCVHHTAIVSANLGNGRLLLLEQNSNNRQYVTQGVLDLGKMVQGMVWMYRPVPRLVLAPY